MCFAALFTPPSDPKAIIGQRRLKSFLHQVDTNCDGVIDLQEWRVAAGHNPVCVKMASALLGGIFGDANPTFVSYL